MKILVTGADGFIGKNLCARLKVIQEEKDRSHPNLFVDDLYEADRETPENLLVQYCAGADFIFHFAGVNRPKSPEQYIQGNYEFLSELVNILQVTGNNCPVMFASSVQVVRTDKYKNSAYGKSKLAAEKLLFKYAENTGADVFIYRFPNVFGKWCRPNYNSAVATFCYNIAHNLPIQVNDNQTMLELLYIDDLVEEMLCILEGIAHRCNYEGERIIPCDKGDFCYVPETYTVSLGEIVKILKEFHDQSQNLIMPEQRENSFRKKLYAAYLSYLPEEKMAIPLKMNTDSRGSFTELLKIQNMGQFSVNITKPGVTKGQHWHNSKWEIFIVAAGHGLIRERKIGTDEVLEFEVFGSKPEAVYMLPGYTHNIINLSETEDLITVIWANELFDPEHPDTFFNPVELSDSTSENSSGNGESYD